MKATHRTECFELDLDDSWTPIEPESLEAGQLAFYNDALQVRLFISGDRINAGDRDLLDLGLRMNAHVLGSIAALMNHGGGTLQRDEPRFMQSPPAFDVAITAQVTGSPELAQQMMVATVLNPWVAIYARLESNDRSRFDLMEDWAALRPALFLAQAA